MRGLKVRSADSLYSWSAALLANTAPGGLRAYVDSQILLQVPRSGGTLTGPLILSADAGVPMGATPLSQVQTLISSAVNALIGSAPATLDTLQEIAAALNNSPNAVSAITTQLTDKASLTTGATFTGPVNVPTVANGDNSTSAASTAWVLANTQITNVGLANFAALATTGVLVRTGADTFNTRTISGGVGRIDVTNGNGVAGNPVIDLALSGVSAGNFVKVSVDIYGRVTGSPVFVAADLPQVTPTSGAVFAGTAVSITAALDALQAAISAAGGTADGKEDIWAGDGTQVTFTFSNIVGAVAEARQHRVLVFVDGSRQPRSAYSISSTGITFTAAPTLGMEIEAVQID